MFSPPKSAPFEYDYKQMISDPNPAGLQFELVGSELQLVKSQSLLCQEDESASPYLPPRNLQRFNSEVFRDFSEALILHIGDNNRFLKTHRI